MFEQFKPNQKIKLIGNTWNKDWREQVCIITNNFTNTIVLVRQSDKKTGEIWSSGLKENYTFIFIKDKKDHLPEWL
jgi:hypothetical protein